MSYTEQRQLSQRGKVKSLLERMEAIENAHDLMAQQISQVFSNQNQRMANLGNLIEAIVELTGGPEVVDAKMAEISDRRAVEESKKAKEALEKGIADGQVEAIDAAGPRTLIVGKEKDKDGETVVPGRVQILYESVLKEYQEKLLGQKVGFTFTTKSGGTFEVLEIYKINEVQESPDSGESEE